MNNYITEMKAKYSLSDIKKYNRKHDLNVLVVGETIIDEYYFGQSLGKSGKAPIVAFENKTLDVYEGGAKAIRNHLEDFCNVDILTGDYDVIKRRYIENKQKLFETYTYIKSDRPKKKINIKDYDLVIVADFGNKFIDTNLKNKIEAEANYICLNTQLNAGNMGLNTINKYSKWNYICIDQTELRLATSNQYNTVEEIIIEKFNGIEKSGRLVSITENKKGSVLFDGINMIKSPSLIKKSKIVDTTGAGDSYFSITSILSYLKAPKEIIGFYGNIAGAIACTYMGNKYTITIERMLKYMEDLLK